MAEIIRGGPSFGTRDRLHDSPSSDEGLDPQINEEFDPFLNDEQIASSAVPSPPESQ